MSQAQLSIEEYKRGSSTPDMTIQQLLALDLTSINQGDGLLSNNTCVPSNGSYSIDLRNCGIGKDELDIYLGKAGNPKDDSLDPSDYLAIDNDLMEVFRDKSGEKTQSAMQSSHLELSSSVAVPSCKRTSGVLRPIQIVNELESEFKPRYKSDYHSQDGKVRSPRYVTDRSNNHWVSIKVTPGFEGYIRIDWVTIGNGQNGHFSMPYKFQLNHHDVNVLDENPIYEPIRADNSGLMKIFLVLIKSKQGELQNVQPLQPFPPPLELANPNHLGKIPRLPPKQLIERYQLEKSQLAFTYCGLAPDGVNYIPDWSTTVFSTVMTERSDESSKKRKITCPQCSCSFHITVDEDDDVDHGKVLKKR